MFCEEENAFNMSVNLGDTHNEFWSENTQVSMTLFIYKKAPQGTFKCP